MEQKCRDEIHRQHDFFVDWLTAKVANEDVVFQDKCACVLASDMVLIPPSGEFIAQPELETKLRELYGCYEGRVFQLEARDFTVLQTITDEYCLVSYREWQNLDHSEETTLRQSTALFRQKSATPHGVEWVHVHETWIQPPSSATKQTNGIRATPISSKKPSSPPRPTWNPISARSLLSRRRHLYPRLEQEYEQFQLLKDEVDGETVVNGIQTEGWKITTQQGSIADDAWLHQATERLAEISQPTDRNRLQLHKLHDHRRLCLPEMVFSHAHVSLENQQGVKVTFGAYAALREWAQAHQDIPLQSATCYRGVQVLKSIDAASWRDKPLMLKADSLASEFHYDWTFSTPHASSSTMDLSWRALTHSGIRQRLLQDQSVPILFFDDILLYEDDLHDNGQVQLSVKLRVMPTCAYCLERLWLRVDQVLVRVRDTRLMLEFDSQGGTLYRDVQWRECPWEELESRGLPAEVKAWCAPAETEQAEMRAFQELLTKLPTVPLPEDLPAYAVFRDGV